MTNQSTKQDDQAEELKKLVELVEDGAPNSSVMNEHTKNEEVIEQTRTREIDILNLPPRNEVHSQTNQRLHIKISRPFVRLLLVIIVILVVLAGLYYVWDGDMWNFPR
ncbi:hypothetical protein WMZ97_13770 [Lentibacillus sp. N15]|uniref:hypothetical protein n=1 Tax=Lentibacillus songyuanensis TaxID=3136161 RepID=UPI0031BABD43